MAVPGGGACLGVVAYPHQVKQTVPLVVFGFSLGNTIAASFRAHEVQVWMVRELLSQPGGKDYSKLFGVGMPSKKCLFCQPQSKSAFAGCCVTLARLLTRSKVPRLKLDKNLCFTSSSTLIEVQTNGLNL